MHMEIQYLTKVASQIVGANRSFLFIGAGKVESLLEEKKKKRKERKENQTQASRHREEKL